MNSRVAPPTSSVSRPTKRPMPCSSWTTRSPVLRSRKSERKPAQRRAACPASGGAPPPGRRPRRRGPRARPRGARSRGRERRRGSGRASPRRPRGRPRGARRRGGRRARCSRGARRWWRSRRGGPRRGGARRRRRWAPAGRRRGRRRPAGPPPGPRRRAPPRAAPRGPRAETRASSGSGDEPLGAALLVLDRPRPEAPGLFPDRLGLDDRHGPGREVRPRRHRRAGHEGDELGEPLGREAALERLEEGERARAAPRSARTGSRAAPPARSAWRRRRRGAA